MGICTKYIFVNCSLGAILTVISGSCKYFCKRLHTFSQICAAAVVFKPVKNLRFRQQITGIDGISDKAAFLSDCPYIYGSQTLDFMPVMLFIIMSHHLISAADTKKYLIFCDGILNHFTFNRHKIIAQYVLFG